METIEFKTVIAENISVVEGLIGTATTDKNGLLSAKDKAFLYQRINGSYAVKIIDYII